MGSRFSACTAPLIGADGHFERTIALPQGIDTDNAKAKFKKRVLKVTIPKKPEAQSSRRKIELTES